jgi:hypothetical protein
MSAPELALYGKEGEGKGRAYKHPYRKGSDNKPITSPSVTTVLKLADKSGLVQWAVDLSVQWCVVNWATLGMRSNEDAFKTARYRHNDVRDERAWVGTGVHETIESLHTQSWNFPELDEEQKRIMLQWEDLNEKWIIKPLLSEFTVWNIEADYAGTADGLWEFTNRETGEFFVGLVDIKTSKNTWPEHAMQIAALGNSSNVLMQKLDDGTWVEKILPQFDKSVLVHLREDKWEIIEVEDTDLRLEEFLAYRHIWDVQSSIKDRVKARVIASSGF